MEVKLYLDKSVEENASIYFDLSKKAKKKFEGAKKAIIETEKKIESLKKKAEKEEAKKEIVVNKKPKWYHKFRWCFTSDGYLMIGGRDATTNEIIIKKHTDDNDLVFHTDMAGSPFVVLKDGKSSNEVSKNEASIFTADFSKAWKNGFRSCDVFYVEKNQVTKEAEHGEYLSKGSFKISGKTTYLKPVMSFAVGVYDNFMMGGPIDSVKKNCKEFVELIQGDEKVSSVAKVVKKKLDYDDLDEIIRVLPNGCKVKNR